MQFQKRILQIFLFYHSAGSMITNTAAFVFPPTNTIASTRTSSGSILTPITTTSEGRDNLLIRYSTTESPEDFIKEEEETTVVRTEATSSSAPPLVERERIRKRDRMKEAIRKLASWSLKDYEWRSNLFKSNEADVQLEKSLARMRGEEPPYVRPMDASDEKIGPLGALEKQAVEWLSDVIEEEGNRAKRIAEGDGNFIRPMDAANDKNAFDDDTIFQHRPLANLERQAVQFFRKIVDSETERAVAGKLRPMELEEDKRGPLGEAERKAVSVLGEISESEKLRMQQSRLRGDVVRPIDIPGTLGEIERAALEFFEAEKSRVEDGKQKGAYVRPKDAPIEGPLGKAEREAIDAIDRVKLEERDRLQSIQKMLFDKRPMEVDRISPLGITEALVVGILRGPKLLATVFDRVKELLQSEPLDDAIQMKMTEAASTNATVENDLDVEIR